ncbi:hypothetical protein B0T24DRAFT_723834 [Lasiosphaeria ovina]|uniref:Uncharacterized protein n=1 Tax=Lasiosphaeria ovina TaxID=92902 RepID=A0AAE0N0K3_9PEZI|nr:hypothetical protein B0T24DRAFT_723834 [Lasiosphaeria ovina]
MFLYPQLTLKVTGTYNFGSTGHHYLMGTQGRFNIVSGPLLVNGQHFIAANFRDSAANPTESPFKAHGEWKWTLLDAHHKRVTGSGDASTHLELYFAHGNDATMFENGSNGGVYFLELVRLAFPDHDSVAQMTWANAEEIVVLKIVTSLWKLGGEDLHYDSRYHGGGRDSHMQHGTLDLRSILTKTTSTANCVDINGLTMATLHSLGRRAPISNTAPPIVKDLRLAAQFPWGYITRCYLFGYEGKPCNNVYWIGRYDEVAGHVGSKDAKQLVDQHDPDRTMFKFHCIVGFRSSRDDTLRAVDVCRAGIAANGDPVMYAGQLTVSSYLDSADDGPDAAKVRAMKKQHYPLQYWAA